MQANEQQMGLHARDMDASIGLVSAHVKGRLNGLVAQTKVRQTYKNWSDANIECVYTFPLGWQSVLLSMRVELNGKRLTGTVKPKMRCTVFHTPHSTSGIIKPAANSGWIGTPVSLRSWYRTAPNSPRSS